MQIARAPLKLIAEDSALIESSESPLKVERLVVDPEAISVMGYVPRAGASALLWVDRDGKKFRASLITAATVVPPAGSDWRFAWGTVGLGGLAPGRYRIGYGLDGAPPNAVHWTSKTVTAN